MYISRRDSDRLRTQLRQLQVTYNVYPYAAGSTLFEMGETRVLSAVTLQQGCPHFLRGKRTGWLTAEYSLLPASTPVRTVREITTNKRSGRTIEISRLIGRAMRAVCDLGALGEQTIFIDCDVLQADGGTRTACISGAYLALRAAQDKWLEQGVIQRPFLLEDIAAVSVGYVHGDFLLDMNFAEDSATEVDSNIVVTRSKRFIELQATAEKAPLEWDDMQKLCEVAWKGAAELFAFYDANSPEKTVVKSQNREGSRAMNATPSGFGKSLYDDVFDV